MSITAFPVLARILKELNLLSTNLGSVAISCAAIDDISAWLLLAVLTAMVHSAQSWRHFAVTLLLLVVFVGSILSSFPPQDNGRRHAVHLFYARSQLDNRTAGNPRVVWRIHGWIGDAEE